VRGKNFAAEPAKILKPRAQILGQLLVDFPA